MGAAVPWIIKGGVALGSMLLGKKATSSAMQRSPEEQRALEGANKALESTGQESDEYSKFGLPVLRQAGDWYSSLLRGDRGAMGLATAAPRAAITDTYRGAAANLDASPLRGGERNLAQSTLNRDKASRLAQLTTGVQPNAAEALLKVGGTAGAAGMYGKAAQAQAYSNLLSQGASNRQYAREEGNSFGKSMGGILTDIIGTGGSGKTPTIKSKSTVSTGPLFPGVPGGTQFQV